MSESLQIKHIDPEETWRLRHEILRPNQPLSSCAYPGDHLPQAFHLGAYCEGKLVGIASLSPEADSKVRANNPFRLRGMAVVPEFRRQEVGRNLLMVAQSELRNKEADVLWCRARQVAFHFYLNNNFVFCSEMYEIEGIGPHKTMFLKLSS